MAWMGRRRRELDALVEHAKITDRAAGVGAVTLVCHADTWVALASTPQLAWSEIPSERRTYRDDGMVEISLSGANLVTLLRHTEVMTSSGVTTHQAAFQHAPDAGSIALRLRREIERALSSTRSATAAEQPGERIPALLLDDTLAPHHHD